MINKVILVGNVGIDPEVRTLESGVKVARVRLATTERIFNRQTNESTEHTEWHTVILWRGLADVVDRFVRKGSQLYIEGQPAHARMDGQGEPETLYDRDHRVGHETARQAIRQSCRRTICRTGRLSAAGRGSGRICRARIAGGRVCATRGTARAARRRSGRSAGRRSRRSAVLKRLRQGMMPYSFHVLTGAVQRNGTRIFIQR